MVENPASPVVLETVEIQGIPYRRFIKEYWTSRQRQASPLHEIAYRACFKAQLPSFFIQLFTAEGDVVYDPFSGRGTTVIEAALQNRRIISNDINVLSKILAAPRLQIPTLHALKARLEEIPHSQSRKAEMDLSMFFHPKTEAEIVSLREYLLRKQREGREDALDSWIRMVATNRLTGHSAGFFSVYTLPPNQAVSAERQIKINQKRRQRPPYRDTRALILRKSASLIRGIDSGLRERLRSISARALFLTRDARDTPEIQNESVQLTVTSPPFLDVVQYAADNWLRCWFNGLDVREVESQLTMARSLEDWKEVMADVFRELFRITRKGGWVAFEVGEVRNGKIRLDEHVVPLGVQAGFSCPGILINLQSFTKTSNIWGVSNNRRGTNTNRIVLFYKEGCE